MMYNFDNTPDRRKFNALKWENIPDDTISMSVADMEFQLMPEVRDAISKLALSGDFGYIALSENDYEAVIAWVYRRCGYRIPREHLIATPGVLYAARTAMHAITKPGDKVIIQTPLHTPSIASASMLGRVPVENRLVYKDGKYYIDFDNLEQHFQSGARVLMMCSPHNPTGRVWTSDELLKVAEIVNRYNGYIITDEIHRDILWGKSEFVSPSQMPEIMDRSISVFSTSKTFNMGAFHIGSAVIPNEELRNKIVAQFYSYGHVCSRPALICATAQTAAYTYGEEWYKQMLSYVSGNFSLALDYLSGTPIRAERPEGTFLLWADITELGYDTDKLWNIMQNNWKVILDTGCMYDTTDYAAYKGKEHHLRFNLALPRHQLELAMERIRKHLK